MFDANQFYPTPIKVASKMQSALSRDRPRDSIFPILEPSAGKGDLILGYPKEKVACLELHPDLRSILKDNGCKVIGSDFLEFNERGVYPSIIMNPPFNEGIAHLFHAWELLRDGGRIVCLLPETVLNDGNSQKQRLNQLLSLYGRVEELGSCFHDAERKTDVPVVMITLNKPAQKFGFNVDFQYGVEDFEAAITPSVTNTLGKTDVIETLVHQYELALESLRESHVASQKLRFAMTGITSHSGLGRNRWDDDLIPNTPFEVHARELKARFWQTVFQKTELEKRATSDFQRKFTEWEKEQIGLAFTASNIRQMLLMFWQNKDQIDIDSLCHVFDQLTRNHAQWITGEAWKTNKAARINKKVIVEYGVNHDQWGFSTSYHKTDFYNDVDKAMCILSGKKFDDISSIDGAIRHFIRETKEYDQRFESEFFKIQIFKKGSVHLWFKDLNLNEEFNRRVAEHRKWIGSNY
jgi:hypothetical protein